MISVQNNPGFHQQMNRRQILAELNEDMFYKSKAPAYFILLVRLYS